MALSDVLVEIVLHGELCRAIGTLQPFLLHRSVLDSFMRLQSLLALQGDFAYRTLLQDRILVSVHQFHVRCEIYLAAKSFGTLRASNRKIRMAMLDVARQNSFALQSIAAD